MSHLTCKNCNHIVDAKYCKFCGQKTNTHRISGSWMVHEIQHSFLHIDKGILFTIKQLFTTPGKCITNFIEGKRVNHFKPIAFVIILATVYVVISHLFPFDIEKVLNKAGSVKVGNDSKKFDPNKVYQWILDHYALFSMFSVVLFAICSLLAFRIKKLKWNFFEHIVMQCYLVGQRLVLDLIYYPTHFIWNPKSQVIAGTFFTLIQQGFTVWSLFQIYKPHSKWYKIILRIVLYYFLFFVLFLLLVIIFAIIYALILKANKKI